MDLSAHKFIRLISLAWACLLACCAERDSLSSKASISQEHLDRLTAALDLKAPKFGPDLDFEPPPGTIPHDSLRTEESYEGNYHWKPDDEPILTYIRPVLERSGKAARLSYAASCRPNEYPFQIPKLRMQPPPPGETGVAAVRAIFQDDGNVVVTEELNGLIKIRIGKFQDAILQTRISRLTLKGRTLYDGALSTSALEWVPEMLAAREMLGFHRRVPNITIISDLRIIQPGWTHLPSLISNATADQILDQIATTFGGIVLYGVCEEPNDIELTFVDR